MSDEDLTKLFDMTLSLEDDDFTVDFNYLKDENVKSKLNLYNIVARINNGESIESVARVIKESLIEQIEFYVEVKSFEGIKGNIFLLLKSDLDSAVSLVSRPFTKNGEIGVYYVRDLGKSMAYVTEDNVKEWSITFEELDEIAIKNLESKSVFPKTMQLNGVTCNLYMYNSLDGYDATRLLTLDVDVLREKFTGRICAGIPNRDYLIVFDDAEDIDIEDVKSQIESNYSSKTYHICNKILVLTDEGWELED